jgi:branched-chain amino acid transport system substrate-binding protein
MANRWRFLIGALILVVMIVPMVAGCTPAATPAKTPNTNPTVQKPKEYVIQCALDLTGPAATMSAPAPSGMADYAKWYNAKGGLDGVPVRFVMNDTKFDRAVAVSIYNRVREMTPKPALVAFIQSPDVDALAQRFAEDKIVNISTSISTNASWPPGWTFCQSNYVADLTCAYFDWLSKEWAKSGESRKCRVALYNPKNSYGVTATAPEAVEFAKSLGNIEIVYNDYFDPAAIDLSSDIVRIMQTNPDWIYGYYYSTWGVAFYRSLDASGNRDKVKVGTSGWGVSSIMADQVGAKMVEGVVGPSHIPPWLPAGQKQVSAGMEWMSTLFDGNNYPKEWRNVAYVACPIAGLMMTSALEATVKKVGWDKMDGPAVYDVMNNMTSIDLNGVITWGVSPGCRTDNKYEMFKLTNGQPLPISDWLTCPDGRPASMRTPQYSWSGVGWPKDYFKK